MIVNVIVEYNPLYQSGAAANRLLSLVYALVNSGVNVEFFVCGGYLSKSEKDTMGINSERNGLKFTYIIRSLDDTKWKKRFAKYVRAYYLKHIIKRRIKHHLDEAISIYWVSRNLAQWKVFHHLKKKKKLILFIELNEFLDIHRYNNTTFLQRLKGDKAMSFFEKTMLSDFDGLALMTNALMNYYQSIGVEKKKLLHLPMTVDFQRFSFSEKKGHGSRIIITYTGVLNNAKDGIDILIKAFSAIHLDFPRATLNLYGGWHYDTPGQLALIKELGMEKRIKWHGQVDKKDIPMILSESSLLVLPRPDSKQARGGFPTKLGEYLAAGKPVCATSVGEIPDYLEDGESVFFAEPGNVDSFAEAMRRALGDPAKASKIGENGRRVAEKQFNATTQAKKLKIFFEELIEKKHDKR